VPRLAGSGFDGVTLLDVLTMSSGVRWSEDYGDANSATRRHGLVLARGGLPFKSSLCVTSAF